VTWADFHSESERLATEAELAFRSGNIERGIALYRNAAEAENRALDELTKDKPRTIGITAVSAVALWYKAHEYAVGAKVAHKWLGGEPLPDFAVDQLHQLLQLIWSADTAQRAGIRFVAGDVLVSVKGGEIVHGGAPLDLIVRKVEEIQAVYYRTVEMLLQRPLRKHGAPSPDVQEVFRPWIFQAPAGSYQFAVRVQEPPQGDLFRVVRPSVENVTSTFLAIVKATAADPTNELPLVVPDSEYRVTFLKLARNLAPTGKRFEELDIRDATVPIARAISLGPGSRDAINSALRKERPPIAREPLGTIERFTGTLRAVHLDQDWLEVTTDEPHRPHVRIQDAGEALDDVVGPMVNRRVIATVERGSRNRLSFRDIELEE
jgi:hypothetical protein